MNTIRRKPPTPQPSRIQGTLGVRKSADDEPSAEEAGLAMRCEVPDSLPAFGSRELVGQALKEQQAEDEFLELGRIHLAAQDVGRAHQEGFELRQGDFIGGQNVVPSSAGWWARRVS